MMAFGYVINWTHLSRHDLMIPAAFVALLVNEEMNFIKKKDMVEEK